MFYREKPTIEFSSGFLGENVYFNTLQIPIKSGYHQNTLDGAPDLIDDEVWQEVPDIVATIQRKRQILTMKWPPDKKVF